MTSIYFGDTKKTYHRIGDFKLSRMLKKIAGAIILAGILTILIIGSTTLLIKQATVSMEYKNAIQELKYLNTRHF